MDKSKFYTKLFQSYFPIILSGLLICAVLLSTSTLIAKYKLGVLDLLFINTCIVGETIAIFALLLRNKHLAGLSIPLLLCFGLVLEEDKL